MIVEGDNAGRDGTNHSHIDPLPKTHFLESNNKIVFAIDLMDPAFFAGAQKLKGDKLLQKRGFPTVWMRSVGKRTILRLNLRSVIYSNRPRGLFTTDEYAEFSPHRRPVPIDTTARLLATDAVVR